MKIIHLRYPSLVTLRDDVMRAFPEWDGDKTDPPQWLDNHSYVKIERDAGGTILRRDVYLLVKNNFTLPAWIQGTEIVGQRNHEFLGHT